MLDLLKDCCNCFLLSLIKKHLNEHIICYNFSFLIEKLIKFVIQSYLSLLNSFLFLSRFSVSLKSLNNYLFRWFAYRSLHSRLTVLANYIMWPSNQFSISSFFPRFSGSGSSVVQVLEVAVSSSLVKIRMSMYLAQYLSTDQIYF